jgi:isoleucyl-tRNA synthetase
MDKTAEKKAKDGSGLKDTLNLPRTDFPMKANLPQTEPRQLAAWEEMRLYHRIQAERARGNKGTFVLHDGPPYPTGEIHLGTGLNKVLKDMVVKSKTMAGFRAPYLPGWDCHGLPIETKVEKELGGKGKVSAAEFRRRCREFADRYIENHRREFRRLGIFGLWEKPYLTMDFSYEATIADAFLTFYEKGYVYRGLKPVYWCIFDGTALAEAEVEYENHTSPSIWVKFPVVLNAQATKLRLDATVKASAVIWTTTPWTLPHNRALAFHPDFDYICVPSDSGNLVLARQIAWDDPKAREILRIKDGAFVELGKGRDLQGLRFQHPFLDNLQVPAVLADYVTLEAGSGIVHTAPGHGAEDFYSGQKYGLEVAAPIDDEGRYLEGLREYKGKTVFEANPHIVELLRNRGALLAEGKLTHSYPHCWRCHQPVIFRATEQWFISMEHAQFRERALEEIKRVQWKPAWGEERIGNMLATRPDWCVSRQRYWGVPLVVFYCAKCGKQLRDFPALRKVLDWFRREGADAWFKHEADELLPPATKCECGGAEFRKETDILDVWFDSGSSHLAALGNEDGGPWPADVYLEGPDQFRGWFQSSLLVSVGVKDSAPYRQVVTHGWTLDEKGQPMSKSLGNAIYPAEICERWGADLMRVWVVSQDYTSDMSLSEAMMGQLAEAYRKIRNTLRFALSNLYDFNPDRDAVPNEQLLEFDRYMLHRTGELVAQCRAWYDSFDFHRVFHAIREFCINDLSAFYFDALKDRLYTSAMRGRARRSAQSAVYRIASALVRLLAPVIVFTAEEVWKYFPKLSGEPESIHMTLFPEAAEFETGIAETRRLDWVRLTALIRPSVLKSLEEARAAKLINSSLEAKVELWVSGPWQMLLEQFRKWLPALFIVSQVEISDFSGQATIAAEDGSNLRIAVQRADGAKCERCWNYSTRVGENATWPTVCERCVAALEENARNLPR